MRPRADAAGNLTDGDASRDQRVRNQRSVAAPGHRLCAHEDHTLLFREIETTLQTAFELRRLHVVGVATEAGIAPPGVRGVRPRTAPPTQPRHVSIVNLPAA